MLLFPLFLMLPQVHRNGREVRTSGGLNNKWSKGCCCKFQGSVQRELDLVYLV